MNDIQVSTKYMYTKQFTKTFALGEYSKHSFSYAIYVRNLAMVSPLNQILSY